MMQKRLGNKIAEVDNMGFVPDDAIWYLAELIMEITVAGATRNVVHRNLMLIRADSPDEAYDKALKLGYEAETEYQNPLGQGVQIKFKGIAQLDVVYDEFSHGAELKYEECAGISPQEIASWILPKEKLRVFVPPPDPARKRDPDYRSQEVLEMVEDRRRRSETE
jgi:Domain of unknown function (DUF4288)